jgi:hypothetical protein
MQITTAAFLLFAATGAVATPVEPKLNSIVARTEWTGVSKEPYSTPQWLNLRITANHSVHLLEVH